MQFGGAAVPLSWFVEQVDLVLMWRTRTFLDLGHSLELSLVRQGRIA